jgi:hypothetical protein
MKAMQLTRDNLILSVNNGNMNRYEVLAIRIENIMKETKQKTIYYKR